MTDVITQVPLLGATDSRDYGTYAVLQALTVLQNSIADEGRNNAKGQCDLRQQVSDSGWKVDANVNLGFADLKTNMAISDRSMDKNFCDTNEHISNVEKQAIANTCTIKEQAAEFYRLTERQLDCLAVKLERSKDDILTKLNDQETARLRDQIAVLTAQQTQIGLVSSITSSVSAEVIRAVSALIHP